MKHENGEQGTFFIERSPPGMEFQQPSTTIAAFSDSTMLLKPLLGILEAEVSAQKIRGLERNPISGFPRLYRL